MEYAFLFGIFGFVIGAGLTLLTRSISIIIIILVVVIALVAAHLIINKLDVFKDPKGIKTSIVIIAAGVFMAVPGIYFCIRTEYGYPILGELYVGSLSPESVVLATLGCCTVLGGIIILIYNLIKYS